MRNDMEEQNSPVVYALVNVNPAFHAGTSQIPLDFT